MTLSSVLQRVSRRPPIGVDAAEDLVRRLFRDHPRPNFSVRLWDGREVSFGHESVFTLAFRDPEAFVRAAGSGDPAEFAEAYVDGALDIEGSRTEAVRLAAYLGSIRLHPSDKLVIASKLGVRRSTHSIDADTRDVQAHYDVSDDFFRLFLDRRMVYSCAYFSHPDDDLDTAQARKLDLVCRKLRLREGERFLDVGCGWGALVIWAAEHYGVQAHGVTLSANQAREARRRVALAGLAGRITIEERHYAELPAEAFDKVASVGMYEHVGRDHLGAYLSAIRRTLGAGGLFLNHGITEPPHPRRRSGGRFIFRHVFPGTELVSIGGLVRAMEDEDFEVADVECLRPHYALTLGAWQRRLQAVRHRAAEFVSERVLRAWDIYLPGCAFAFDEGLIGVHQILAAKPDARGTAHLPLTREDILQAP